LSNNLFLYSLNSSLLTFFIPFQQPFLQFVYFNNINIQLIPLIHYIQKYLFSNIYNCSNIVGWPIKTNCISMIVNSLNYSFPPSF
jgi:hypothetical protein